MTMKKRALVSVSDKTGVVDFCKRLSACGYEIVSTGGTAKALTDAGLPVVGISDVTEPCSVFCMFPIIEVAVNTLPRAAVAVGEVL